MSNKIVEPADPAEIERRKTKVWHNWLDSRALDHAKHDRGALIVPFGAVAVLLTFFGWGYLVALHGLGEVSSLERGLWVFSVPTVVTGVFLFIGNRIRKRSLQNYRASYKISRRATYAFYREPLPEDNDA